MVLVPEILGADINGSGGEPTQNELLHSTRHRGGSSCVGQCVLAPSRRRTPLLAGAAHREWRQNAEQARDPSIRGRRFYAEHARAILVFPSVLKAGFVFGGETGNGVLAVGMAGRWVSITPAAAPGALQIGGQDFSYVVFFMRRLGSWPTSTMERRLRGGHRPEHRGHQPGLRRRVANTTTITHDVYAFPFNQKGLMADLTLQGTKITRIHPD